MLYKHSVFNPERRQDLIRKLILMGFSKENLSEISVDEPMLTLENMHPGIGEPTVTLYRFAALDTDRSNIQFAIRYHTNNEDGSHQIYIVKHMHPGDPHLDELINPPIFLDKKNLFQPACYYSKKEKYILYPVIEGMRLDEYCHALRIQDNAFAYIMKIALNICQTAARIEQHNAKICALPENSKKNPDNISGLLRGVWDLNADNMIVQKNREVTFIDYQPMKADPYSCFRSIVMNCFYFYAGMESSKLAFESLLALHNHEGRNLFNATDDQVRELLQFLADFKGKQIKNFTVAVTRLETLCSKSNVHSSQPATLKNL